MAIGNAAGLPTTFRPPSPLSYLLRVLLAVKVGERGGILRAKRPMNKRGRRKDAYQTYFSGRS